ncbi:Concanavalin A-like lectin/glucanase, subgroup domain-containing protein [Rozella allomycis CSF55]|uniref:Concanavalin A-like lectin/glucanase, subgroup domain-containing protein n=1 Tax=Rozella allomycis (strain CSF55) TaxID=988480 RepID=A0A075B0F7_ROZAC|nr:Concanavalin A-like lectin/glucanase, subgroup domain-containing protein [Rozella allomycis CSF55]|eukprot:EPZ36059.1 Concanavalin A-like lectin/glucanase, subgroup domain-containing protein [Rozella allomycis CSF55]
MKLDACLAALTVLSSINAEALFVEKFESKSLLGDKWVPSEAKKDSGDVLAYDGQWEIEEASVLKAFDDDFGLVVKSPARLHGITRKFDKAIQIEDEKPFVVQYEVKLQKSLECGGAYLKLLTAGEEEFNPTQFHDKTPYTIMFGPDKCGSSNKVHFIFRHKNPVTGQIEEKALNNPPTAKITEKSVLYTLIVKPDNKFEIRIDSEKVREGSLLEDFTPSVIPPKEIEDPNDTKPEDWDEREKIPDESAVKPEDWDEEAPKEIEDINDTKPSDWLDDEPLLIPDVDAAKPDDWNEEEDGKWEAPLVENPKCNSGKCGVWQRRKISNPNYRGKWKRPLISNPNYKGKWSPKKIPNPEYFEDDKIYKFTPMTAVGFELWTMQNDILFDNIFISDSIQDAEKFSDETFKLKSKEEALKEPKEEESTVEDKQESSFEDSSSFGPYLDALKNIDISKIVELLKTEPMTFIPFFAAVFFPILIVYFVKWAISNPVSDSKEKIESDDGFQEEQNDEVETNEIKTQEEKEDNSLNQVNAQSDESTDNE